MGVPGGGETVPDELEGGGAEHSRGKAWSRNRPLLEALAGRKLPEKPRAAQLLAILSCRLQLDADGPAALQQADGADPPAAPER